MPPYTETQTPVGRCAHTPPPAISNREISPHQSLRDSFSSRRSRLAAHIASALGEVDSTFCAEDGGVKVHQNPHFAAVGGIKSQSFTL